MPIVLLFLLIAQSVSYSVGKDPRAVALIDVNGDARLDIVTANAGSRDVSVLLGGQEGDFNRGPSSPTLIEPAWMTTGDANGDGHPDVAVAEHESHRAAVLLGDGSGRFQLAPGSPFTFLAAEPQHVHGLVFGDFDRDGHLDLVTANNARHSLSVLIGDGRGRFRPAATSPVGIARVIAGLAVADLTGDERLDLVVPGEGAADLTVLLGDGRGGLQVLTSRVKLATSGNAVAIGRINQDAFPDVAVAHNESALVTILLGDGRGDFSRGPTLTPGHLPRTPILRDVNGDGVTDLMLVDVAAGRVTVWHGDGRGDFRPAPGGSLTVGLAPMGLAVAARKSDGRLLIVTANSGGNNVTVIAR
jgi:FG-GAP-like repeat